MPDRLQEKAVIGWTYGNYEPDFVHSMLQVQMWDALNGKRLIHDGPSFLPVSTTEIASGRNKVVRAFLDETDCDWLWFFDTDQDCEPDTLERLIQSAHPVEAPIMSGLLFAMTGTRTLPVSPVPTQFHEETRTIREVGGYPVGERRWKVACAGTGCLLIHRTVLEAVWNEYGEQDAWPAFKYAQTMYDGKPDMMGEDYTFSLRAQALGFPVYVDTTIECGHIKKHTFRSADFWQQFPTAEIPRRRATVIPTKAKNLPLLRELIPRVIEQSDLTVVLDNGCSKQAKNWLSTQNGLAVVEMPDAGIHEMWNVGAQIAQSRWRWTDVAFLNDDLRIPDLMVPTLQATLGEHPELMVVCPNYDQRDMLDLEYRSDICANRYDGTGGIAGFAFMVRAEFLWNYRFPEECKWWFGDNDLLLAAQGAAAIVGATSVEHVDGGSQTADWESPEMKAQVAADQEAWLARLKAAGVDVKVEAAS